MNKVTVLVSVYNAEKYIRETIESVLYQTYREFDFIIIDNGSNDKSLNIINNYRADNRIKVIHLDSNIGLSGAMNLGLDYIVTKYTAHIDADDVWLPTKLEKQMAFLNLHPDYCLLATWIQYIDKHNNPIGESKELYTTWKFVEKRYKMNKAIVFNHSSIIFDTEMVKSVGGYHKQFWPAEDADLCNRLIETGKKMIIYPEVLTKYRIFDGANSITKLREMNLMFRYVKYCMRERRSGRPEITVNEYKQINKGFWKHANEYRKDTSIYHYKKAVAAYSSKSLFSVCYHLFFAFMFNPSRTWSIIKIKTVR